MHERNKQRDEILRRNIYESGGFEKQFDSLASLISKKCNLFYSIAIIHIVKSKMKQYQNNSFITVILVYIFNFSQKLLDRFVKRQEDSIEKYWKSIKKTTILPFVAKLPPFLLKIDEILIKHIGDDDDENFGDECLVKMKVKLFKKIFDKIEVLKGQSEKHSAVYSLKNYLFIIRHFSLENEKNELIKKCLAIANERFVMAKDEYCMNLLNYQSSFKSFFSYFENINVKLQEMDADDIRLQSKFSKLSLQKIIVIFNDSENKKRIKHLEECLTRMSKHIGKDNVKRSSFKYIVKEYNMFFETWKYFKQYIVKKLGSIEKAINKCYPGFKEEILLVRNVLIDFASIDKKNKRIFDMK